MSNEAAMCLVVTEEQFPEIFLDKKGRFKEKDLRQENENQTAQFKIQIVY